METRIESQENTSGMFAPVAELPGQNSGPLVVDFALIAGTETVASLQTTQKADTVATPRKPVSQAQIQQRYRWWQQENKLLVGGSRYMQPTNELIVVVPGKIPVQGIDLPARPRNSANYDWLTLSLLVALGIFASVRTIWNKYMMELFQSVVNYATANRMLQEKNTSVIQGAFQLDVLFYLIFSIFTFQLINYYAVGIPFKNIQLFMFTLALIAAYFFLKKLIFRLVGFLTEKNSVSAEFVFNMNNFGRVTGIVLFPVVTVIAFYPFSTMYIPVSAGIILISLIYFLLIIRGFVILLKKQFPIFYLFLYFCTLEFLPLVLLYKILVV